MNCEWCDSTDVATLVQRRGKMVCARCAKASDKLMHQSPTLFEIASLLDDVIRGDSSVNIYLHGVDLDVEIPTYEKSL
jgi:hypothetical protein